MITLQAGAIRLDVNTITSDAQAAFSAAQGEILKLLEEASQNAARVDQSVLEMSAMKTQIVEKIAELDAKAAAMEARVPEVAVPHRRAETQPGRPYPKNTHARTDAKHLLGGRRDPKTAKQVFGDPQHMYVDGRCERRQTNKRVSLF